MQNFPTPPFRVRGVADFNVAPISVGQKYTITDVSQDGSQWQTMAPNGRLGWFPMQMCKPVGPSQANPRTTNNPRATAQTQTQPRTNPTATQQQRGVPAASPSQRSPQQAQRNAPTSSPQARVTATTQQTSARIAPRTVQAQRQQPQDEYQEYEQQEYYDQQGDGMDGTLFGDVVLEEWDQ